MLQQFKRWRVEGRTPNMAGDLRTSSAWEIGPFELGQVGVLNRSIRKNCIPSNLFCGDLRFYLNNLTWYPGSQLRLLCYSLVCCCIVFLCVSCIRFCAGVGERRQFLWLLRILDWKTKPHMNGRIMQTVPFDLHTTHVQCHLFYHQLNWLLQMWEFHLHIFQFFPRSSFEYSFGALLQQTSSQSAWPFPWFCLRSPSVFWDLLMVHGYDMGLSKKYPKWPQIHI